MKMEARSTQVTLGQPITVKLTARSLINDGITNVALIDLLPGGFEILRDTARAQQGKGPCDYIDLREDRAIFYATIPTDSANDYLSDQGDESW